MPGISLTIRNLTSTPLELKLVERYALPNTSSHYGGFLRNWAGGATNGTHISSPHIAEHSQSFESQEASIAVASFQTLPTDVKFAEKSPPHEKLRLTFEVENQRYRIDVPSSKIESQTLIPLSTHAKLQFTGVFHQQQAHLTVYSSANPQSWMQMLKDATPLSACSIPGTHNSPAYYRALPTVRCQAVSPRQQLENGVRFFDIRVQIDSPTSPRLALVHAVFPVSLTGPKYLRDLLNDIFAFLDENPSETLLMSLKREGVGSFSDQDLGRILHDHYTTGKDADRWYVDPDIPTLGQVRGKIVLMRRFAIDDAMRALHDARGWATDAECWQDNTPHDLHGTVCVQDFYEVLESVNIAQKLAYVEAQMERAAACVCALPGITTDAANPVPPQPFHLNFLSASNFWKVGCWPERVARRCNPAAVEWLCTKHHPDDGRHGDGGTGIVVCDWVGAEGDWDLVRCIVGWNSRLMVREMSL